MIMFFSIVFFKSFLDENENFIYEYLLLIRFLCLINHTDLRINLIEFHCSISSCNCCILFELLNPSISMSCTIASCHFLSILISSNSNKFFHTFRYSINFCALKFSTVMNTICCSVRESCIVCINTSNFQCIFNSLLILFRYSTRLIFEILFLILQLYVRFCTFCKVLLFMHFYTFCSMSKDYLCS